MTNGQSSNTGFNQETDFNSDECTVTKEATSLCTSLSTCSSKATTEKTEVGESSVTSSSKSTAIQDIGAGTDESVTTTKEATTTRKKPSRKPSDGKETTDRGKSSNKSSSAQSKPKVNAKGCKRKKQKRQIGVRRHSGGTPRKHPRVLKPSNLDTLTTAEINIYDIRFNSRLDSDLGQQQDFSFDLSTVPAEFEKKPLIQLIHELRNVNNGCLFRDKTSIYYKYVLYRIKQVIGYPYIYPNLTSRNLVFKSFETIAYPWLLYFDPSNDKGRSPEQRRDVLYQIVPMYGVVDFHPQPMLPEEVVADLNDDFEENLIVDSDAQYKLNHLTTRKLIAGYLSQLALNFEPKVDKSKSKPPYLVLNQDESGLSGQMYLRSTAVSFIEPNDAEELEKLTFYDKSQLLSDSSNAKIASFSRYRFAHMLKGGEYYIELDYAALEYISSFSIRALNRASKIPFYQVTLLQDFIPLDNEVNQANKTDSLIPSAVYRVHSLYYYHDFSMYIYEDLQYISPSVFEFVVTRRGYQKFYRTFALDFRNKLKLLKMAGHLSVNTNAILGLKPLLMPLTREDLNLGDLIVHFCPLSVNNQSDMQLVDRIISKSFFKKVEYKAPLEEKQNSLVYKKQEPFQKPKLSIRQKILEFERKYEL